jgi:hypothetical protein
MKITSAHAIAFTALLASVGGGLAVAHNGDTDKIHFCISNAEAGNVRAVPPDGSCQAGETATDVRIQNVAYHEATAGSRTYAATSRFRTVSRQLLVPANGDSYALAGKLVVSKRGGATRSGVVSCLLRPTDNTPPDRVAVTVRRGESAALSFLSSGKTDGRPGQTAAVRIACSSPNSAFTISGAKLTALPVNTVSKGVPVA